MRPQRTLQALTIGIALVGSLGQTPSAHSQETSRLPESERVTEEPISVDPVVDDAAIERRLSDLLRKLEDRGWLRHVVVDVDGGIVVISGNARSDGRRTRAAELAGRIEGVTVVINDLKVDPPNVWDTAPVAQTWNEMARSMVAAIPYLVVAMLILIGTVFTARLVSFVATRFATRRIKNPLLRGVAVSLAAAAIFVLGIYLVLRTTGLTNLALTVLGGTGLFGLVMGFAFRNIAENFLCGVLLSINQPFRQGDLVEIASYRGIVKKVTTRGTWLLTLDGNYVRLPNAKVYGEVIRNITANPSLRLEFPLLIGYSDGLRRAQEIAVASLVGHPEVLGDPPPLCLAEEPRADGIALRVYFWVDSRRTSRNKILSSAIRLVLRSLREAGFPPPDEGQKILFPQGLEVSVERRGLTREIPEVPHDPEPIAISAEGASSGEADDLRRTRQSAVPDAGADLLESDTPED